MNTTELEKRIVESVMDTLSRRDRTLELLNRLESMEQSSFPFSSSLRVPEMIVSGGGGGGDYSKFCFGFTVDGAVVTIIGGEITWGKTVFTIASDVITITADGQYIGLECSYDGGAIIGPSTDIDTFRSDDMTKRIWLYRFDYIPDHDDIPASASLALIGKPLGNWDIGSEFAPS